MKTYTLEELKLAQAKGCRIEYCDVDDGDWFVVGGDFAEKMSKAAAYKLRIHPADEWRARLPRLREGAKWHREDFTNEMLEGGCRPLIKSETARCGDQAYAIGDTEWCDVIGDGNVDGTPDFYFRTRRPVPPKFLHESELASQPFTLPKVAAVVQEDADQAAEFYKTLIKPEAKPSTPAPDYGEPWNKEMYNTELGNTGDYEGHLEIFDRNNGRRVAECCNPDDENEADFDRIIACVNPMAGIADPAAFVAEAKEMREVINQLKEALLVCAKDEDALACDDKTSTNGCHLTVEQREPLLSDYRVKSLTASREVLKKFNFIP